MVCPQAEGQDKPIDQSHLRRAAWLIGQLSGPLAGKAERVLGALATEAKVSVAELTEAVEARR